MLEKAVDADVAITNRDGIVRLASSFAKDQMQKPRWPFEF